MFDIEDIHDKIEGDHELSPQERLNQKVFGTIETNRIFIAGLIDKQSELNVPSPYGTWDNEANMNAYCAYLIHIGQTDKALRVIEENKELIDSRKEWSHEYIYAAVNDFLMPTGQFDTAKRVCEVMTEASWDDLWKVSYAEALIELGEYEKVLEVYKKVDNTLFNDCSFMWPPYVKALIGSGREDEARQFCEGAGMNYDSPEEERVYITKLKAEIGKLLMERRTYMEQGESDKEREVIENILEMPHSQSGIYMADYFELLMRCAELGNYELMKRCAEHASDASSDDHFVSRLMLRGVIESKYTNEE